MLTLKDKKLNKYQRIEKDLLAKIHNGHTPVGSQIPTEVAISTEYGVSRLTARKAIGNLQHQGYLDRTPGRGTFVTDWKKRSGRDNGLRKDIAAIYVDADTNNLWNMRVLQAASLEAERLGYHVTFCGVTGSQLCEGKIPLALRQETASSAFINGSLTDLQMKHLLGYDLPCLFVGNYESTHGRPAVSVDAEDMTYKITKSLLSLDRGPVTLVIERFRLYYTRQVYEGYQHAIFESRNPTNLLNACSPKDCAAIVGRLKESARKEHCLIVMPSHVQGIVDHMKLARINMERVTMVVIGQREPWWHFDDQINLCEIKAELLATEAVKQLTAMRDGKSRLKDKIFRLSIATTGDNCLPFQFSWS